MPEVLTTLPVDALTIINWVFLGIIGFIVVVNALTGFGRGMSKSITKLIRVILSIAISALLTRIIVNVVANGDYSEQIMATLQQFVEGNEIINEIGDIDVVVNYVVQIVMALIGPIIFIILFLLVSIIMLIPFAIINGILKRANINRQIRNGDVDEYNSRGRRNRIRVRKMPLSWLFGFAISAVCGALIGLAIMCPFAGYVTAVSTYYDALEETNLIEPTDDGEEVAATIHGAKDVQGVELTYKYSSFLFDYLTSYTVSNETVSVFTDVDAVLEIAPDIMDFAENMEGFEDIDAEPLKTVTAKLKESGRLKYVVVSVLKAAGEKWGNGETFLGVDINNMTEGIPDDLHDYFGIVFRRLADMSAEDQESVIASLGVIDDFADGISDVAKIFNKIKTLTENEVESFEDLDLSPLDEVADIIAASNSSVLKELVVKVFNDAGTKWGNGEAFFDIDINSMAQGYSEYLGDAFDLFANSTEATIGNDIKTFTGAIGVFGDIMDEFITLTEADDFSDFSVISTPLENVADILDDTDNALAKKIVVSVLNGAGEKWNNGEEFMGLNIATALPDDFGGYLTDAFDLFENTRVETLGADLRQFSGAISTLGEVYDEITTLTGTSDFSDFSVLAEPLENVSTILEETDNTLAKKIVASIISDAGAKWNDGEEFMGLNITTALPDDFGNYMSCAFELFENTTEETVGADIGTFASTITDFSGIYDAILDEDTGLVSNDFSDIPNIDVSSLRTMSDILDNANTITRTVAAELLSDAGTKWIAGEEFMGMNIKADLPDDYKNSLDSALNLLASSTEENVSNNVKTFTDAIESIKSTYVYVQTLTSTEASLEEMRDNLNDVLSNITPESAPIVADAISGDVLSSIGVSEEAANTVADLVSGVITDIAELPEEDKGAEAEALNNIISYVTSASDDSTASATPDEVITSVLDSTVISDQIVSAAENEGTFDVSEEESAAITDAITQYETNNAGNISEEDQKVLDALKAMFGFTPAP